MDSIEATITIKVGTPPGFWICCSNLAVQQQLEPIARRLLQVALRAWKSEARERSR